MNLTTGASSTSCAAASAAADGCSSSLNSTDRSSSTSCFSETSLRSSARLRTTRSLSSSTTIASIDIEVWNLTSSRTWLFEGSETAIARRLPRLRSGSTRRSRISFRSTRSSGKTVTSSASRSASGRPKTWEANSAMSTAVSLRLWISCSMNGAPAFRAWAVTSSATFSGSRPCWTRARARPLKALM